MIFLILIGAILFSGFLSLSGTPGMLGTWIDTLALSPLATLLLIIALYILLGAFLDTMAMIILSIPIFFPMVMSLGYDPVWFGILVVLVVCLCHSWLVTRHLSHRGISRRDAILRRLADHDRVDHRIPVARPFRCGIHLMARPNIVLILTDNQQASTLGCYGNTEVRTPNLDRYAREGMQFRNAFCPNAFCSPCRASVLTGLMPSQHGVHSWIDDRNRQDWPNGWHALAGLATLPELLREQGYRTGLFGKYHLGESATAGPGWDAWVTMEHGHTFRFQHLTDIGPRHNPDSAIAFRIGTTIVRWTASHAAPFQPLRCRTTTASRKRVVTASIFRC